MEKQNSMSVAGIGPRLVLTILPIILLASLFMFKDPEFMTLCFLNKFYALIIGLFWLAIGLIFFLASVITFSKNFKKGKLIKHGPYGICKNPIYASFIVFFVPALAILLRSGVVFIIDLALYINFKILIREEYVNLLRIFGDEYKQYSRKVNEIIPIPKF